MNQNSEKTRIDKLIAFFTTLKKNRAGSDEADYSSWDQTEAEYQRQQAEWIKKVKEKKDKKTGK